MSNDEIFDPEIHSADKDGNPTLNKDGSFRKKRKDAPSRTAPRTRSKSGGPAGSPREKYRKSVADFLAIPVTGLTLADPVLGYAAAEVAPAWSEGLADLAMDQPRLAAALEKLGGVGAVGGLLGLAVMTGVQFGHLVGKVPPHIAQMMGCKSREEIETILEQRGAAMAARRGQSPEHARAEAPAEGVRVAAHA